MPRPAVIPSVRRGSRVPRRWQAELSQVLIGPERLARRVRQLAFQIERDLGGEELLVVALLNGTVLFLADLIRHLSVPMKLDFIGVSSYGKGTEPGDLVFTKELKLEVKGRSVLLVDDILDTGKTLQTVSARIARLRPAALRTCVLLNKSARRQVDLDADYVGFNIPDEFVVGYGMDYAERYRNLPFVGVLRAAPLTRSP